MREKKWKGGAVLLDSVLFEILKEILHPILLKKIREKVHTSFYVRHIFSYQLRNIEDVSLMVMYTNTGSPWFERLSEAEKWLSEREKVRLDPDNINRPDTKWVFVNHFNVDLKVVHARPSATVGHRPLTKLAAWLCAWARRTNGSTWHLPGQLMSLALHCGTPRCKTRSKHNGSTRAC